MAGRSEGDPDYDQPPDEGGEIPRESDPRTRSMGTRFPGEANEKAEKARKKRPGDLAPVRQEEQDTK